LIVGVSFLNTKVQYRNWLVRYIW